jgi:hypothetical protein
MQNQNPEDLLKDLPLTAEDISFKADEMIACEKCSRTNAPNRLKCMYCGAELSLSAEQSARVTPHLRKLENWENGFNLIYLPQGEKFEADAIAGIGKITGMTVFSHPDSFFELQKPLPLARVESVNEALIVQNRLQEFGLQTKIVSDESLAAEVQPKRLRGLEFQDEKILLILFNNDEVEEIGAKSLNLIVSGVVYEKAVQSTEARKKGETKILEATETASDEILIDIYTQENANGYRILTKGFDFSCLGAEKGILARENIKRLIEKLQQVAPEAKLIDDYTTVRNLVGEIWEVEQRKDSQGLTRQRFGKFDLSSVSSSSNLQQFTKYSRLQWHIL